MSDWQATVIDRVTSDDGREFVLLDRGDYQFSPFWTRYVTFEVLHTEAAEDDNLFRAMGSHDLAEARALLAVRAGTLRLPPEKLLDG